MVNTRGKQRLCCITYPLLSEWTELSIGRLRTLQCQGAIDVYNLEGILTWVNSRRAKAGRPLIGIPHSIGSPPTLEAPPEPPVTT